MLKERLFITCFPRKGCRPVDFITNCVRYSRNHCRRHEFCSLIQNVNLFCSWIGAFFFCLYSDDVECIVLEKLYSDLFALKSECVLNYFYHKDNRLNIKAWKEASWGLPHPASSHSDWIRCRLSSTSFIVRELRSYSKHLRSSVWWCWKLYKICARQPVEWLCCAKIVPPFCSGV